MELSTSVYMEVGCPGWPGYPASRATRGELTSHTFLLKTHGSVYILDRVARLPGAPCRLARGTLLGGIAFYHVNGSCRAIPPNRGEINRENMAARGEFFRSYHLPVLSAEQNDSKFEEINVIEESQADYRPVPVQEAEIRWKNVSLVGRSKDNSRSPLTVPVRCSKIVSSIWNIGCQFILTKFCRSVAQYIWSLMW